MSLPKELQDQLGGKEKPDRPYNTHDLALSYIANNDGVTANDLLIYLWAMTKKVTSRNYLYHVLRRLRNRGLIETTNRSIPLRAKHICTPKGFTNARPFMGVPDTWEDDDDE